MTFAALLTFLFTTPAGLTIVVQAVGLVLGMLHTVGVNVPAVSPILNGIQALISKMGGGTTPVVPPGGVTPPAPAVNTGHPILDFIVNVASSGSVATLNPTLKALQTIITDVLAAQAVMPPAPPAAH